MKKYLVYPGKVKSWYDGEIHYISAPQLISLYGVDPKECIIIDHNRPETYLGLDMKKYKKLFPMADATYPIFNKEGKEG